MIRNQSIFLANAALPHKVQVILDLDFEEWQVHYPTKRRRSYCPIFRLCGTAKDIAARLGFAMRHHFPEGLFSEGPSL